MAEIPFYVTHGGSTVDGEVMTKLRELEGSYPVTQNNWYLTLIEFVTDSKIVDGDYILHVGNTKFSLKVFMGRILPLIKETELYMNVSTTPYLETRNMVKEFPSVWSATFKLEIVPK